MKKLKTFLVAILIAIATILFTGWVAFSSHIELELFRKLCFYFHLEAFGIGFTGGSDFEIMMYYIKLLAGLSLVNYLIIVFIRKLSKHLSN